MYGGPDTLEGKFQTASGLPDRQGWIGVDLTRATSSHWHLDSYNCANLDPSQSVNHAWWCGDGFPSCGGTDPVGGYGNNYQEYLDYHAEVLDDQSSTNLTISAVLNHDNEPGYDFLRLKYENAGGLQDRSVFNGYGDSLVISETITFHPGDYVPHPDSGIPSCHLRWEGTSDGAWSDEDCQWQTAGLAQIDLIRVSGDNGVVTILEDCEGTTTWWRVSFPSGVGDFSKVWPLLDDLDPDDQNDTPQFAFIDDGIVVPGTGGSQGVNWTYGPDGYTIYMHAEEHWVNEIWSPPISLAAEASSFTSIALSYDVYEHVGLCQPQGGRWRVRSRGSGAWSEWQWPDGWISADGEYLHMTRDIKPCLGPDDHEVQVALGVGFAILGWGCWAWTGQTPAPYYDNVSVSVVGGLSELPDEPSRLLLGELVPNPFNPSTSVSFVMPQPGLVVLAVYDLRGQLVRVLLDEQKATGTHTATWDGRDDHGASVSAGEYIFRLNAGGKSLTKKGTLLK